MKIRTLIKIVMMLAVLSFIWGCGGGGGGVQGSATGKVVSKSTLAGVVSPSVMGVEVTLVLPAGVTVKADASGATLAGVVTALAPNDVTGSNGLVLGLYTPASGANPGTLKITIVRGDTPFVAGDFFTIACDVAAGVTVSAADFGSKGSKAFDAKGVELTSPLTTSITVGGTSVSTTNIVPAQTALKAGFYDLKHDTYNNSTITLNAYAISNIGLGADGSSLTETWSYWDGAAKWITTNPFPTGLFNTATDYYLTSTGWKLGDSSAPAHTIAFNADGTAILTNKYDGSQAKITVTSTDISGQKLSYKHFPLKSTALPLDAGSVRYNMVFDQITDSYDVWNDYWSTSLTTPSNLLDVPTSSFRDFYIDSDAYDTEIRGSFDSVTPGAVTGSVTIYQIPYSVAGSGVVPKQAFAVAPPSIGTATWAIKTVPVSGTQLLMITIPQDVRDKYKLGGDPLFAVVNVGGNNEIRQGTYYRGGQTAYTRGGTAFNKVVADYVVANFTISGGGTATAPAKAISKAILGF